MTQNFFFNEVKVKKHDEDKWLMVRGEVSNETGKDFNAVCFRAVLFIRTVPVGNVTFVISGLRHGQTRLFEVQIGELEYDKIGKDITKCDIYPESFY